MPRPLLFIYANGTASPSENPTYAQRLNILTHERGAARAALRERSGE